MSLVKKEIGMVLMGLAANFGAKIPEGLLEIWHEAFSQDGFTIEQIKYAAGKIIRSKTESYGRLPTYAEFLEILQGNKEQSAQIQAQKVIDLIRTEGSSGNPELDPIVKEVIRSRFGGWQSLCGSLEEGKLQWFIRDFKEAYLSTEAENERLMLPDRDEAKQLMKKITGG
ncbi:MAG: hypothetical protein ABIJ52_03375 [Pseudomonadota bacterium]|nr:hypothetical protein [Pseudomonadota bacterium]